MVSTCGRMIAVALKSRCLPGQAYNREPMTLQKIKKVVRYAAIGFGAVLAISAIGTAYLIIWGFGGEDGTLKSLTDLNGKELAYVDAIPKPLKQIRLKKPANYALRKSHRGWFVIISGTAQLEDLQGLKQGYPTDPLQFHSLIASDDWFPSLCEDYGIDSTLFHTEFSPDASYLDDFHDPASRRLNQPKMVFDSNTGYFTYTTWGSWDRPPEE